jgi:hypothetical protein
MRPSYGFSLGARIALQKITKIRRAAADEDGHYCFAAAL